MRHRLRANSAALATILTLTVGFAACGSDSKSSATTTEETRPSDTDDETTVGDSGADTTDVEATGVDDTEAGSPSTTARPTTTSGRATTTAGGASSTTSTDDTPGAPADRVSFTSTQGDYTVMFPDTPQTQTQNAPLPDGSTLVLEIVGAEQGQQFFATARGEYPAGSITDVAQSLQGAEDQAIANVQGTLIDSQDITLQGRPGRQFSASVTRGGTTGTVIQRVYLDGDTIYENIVVGPGTITVDDEDVAAFLGSFAFTS